VKAYVCFCFDDEDSFENEIDNCMVAELAVQHPVTLNLMKACFENFGVNKHKLCNTWKI